MAPPRAIRLAGCAGTGPARQHGVREGLIGADRARLRYRAPADRTAGRGLSVVRDDDTGVHIGKRLILICAGIAESRGRSSVLSPTGGIAPNVR